MDALFNTQLPDGQRPDMQLCIFPHLKEFIAIDLREQPPRVMLLDTDNIFIEEFYRNVESEFSEVLREGNPFPFAHFINLPLRLEEIVRETAMTFILERLGVDLENFDDTPTVIVFVVSGGALTTRSEQVVSGLRELLGAQSEDSADSEWDATISRLVAEENRFVHALTLQELTDAMKGDSPDYFTLWESRN